MAVNPQDAGNDQGFPEDPRQEPHSMQPPIDPNAPAGRDPYAHSQTDLANWGWGAKEGQEPTAVSSLPTDPMDKAFDPKPAANDPMDPRFDPKPNMGDIEPVSRIESQNRETSWYKNVVTKFADDLYTRFISKEGEGEFSRQLREIEVLSGYEPGVLKDRPLADALHKTIQDIAYAGARTLEGYLGLASDAIRGTVSTGVGLVAGKEIGEAAGEAVMDPGIQATIEGIGPPGAMAAAGLHLISRFGTLGKVKVTGGFGDATNLDRARDMGIIGPTLQEVHVKADGSAMSAREIAEAQIRPPSAAFPSNRNYDGLLTDISGSVKLPDWLTGAAEKIKEKQGGISTVGINDLIETSGKTKEEVHEALAKGAREGDISLARTSVSDQKNIPEVKNNTVLKIGDEEFHTATFKTESREAPAAGMFVKTEPPTLRQRVEQTIQEIGTKDKYPYVPIAKVKAALPDVSLADLHKEIKENPKLEAYREDNQSKLTPADRDAAMQVGAEPRHKVFLTEPPEPVGDKVRVHTDHEATMLDANQSLYTLAKNNPAMRPIIRGGLKDLMGVLYNDTMTGQEAYTMLAKKLGSPEDASKALHAVGVQGIKVEGGHVVFDSRLVEPLQEKGAPVPPPPPPPPRAPPAPPQRAHNGVATDRLGNIRSDVWKGIHDEGDVRALVDQVNEDNGGFATARAGEMPAEHVLTISQATGIPAHELVTDGIGIKFNNDSKVRAGMQALHDTAHQWHSAAQQAVSGNDVQSLIKYQEQELLHGVIQEFVTGKLAEAGRSLAVTQEFYEGRGTQRPLAKEPAKPKPRAEGAEPEKPTFSKSDGLKEFREKVKDKETLDAFNKARGESTEEVRSRAKRVSELNPATNAVVREGAKLKKAKEIEDSPWYEKLYRESLVSGPFSHFRYAVAGVIRNGLGSTVVPFFNATLHTVEAAFGKQFQPGERARFGEIGMGLMTGHTEAFQAMLESTRTGFRPPLPGEVRYDKAGNPIPGWPSGGGPFMRAVAGIHVYHSFIGYAREIKVQAYRRAIEAGFDPRSSTFGQKLSDYVANPTPAAVKSALDVAQNMSITTPLGKIMGPASVAFRNHPLGFLAWPFTHVPVNVAKKGMEYSPVLQFLSKNVRDDLFGANGATKQAAAFGKVMVGWGVYGTFAALGEDYITGAGPTDPDQREEWNLTNQPYSFRNSKDGEWHSYEGWGPMSIALGWSADMGAMGRALHNSLTGPKVTDVDYSNRQREMAEGGWLVAHAIGHLADEAGLTTVMDIANLISGNSRGGAREDQRLGSSLQPISLLGQAATARDPWSRQIDGWMDAFRARIPGKAWGFGRESLAQKLDWLGNPIANPRQGFNILMPTKAAVDPQLQEVYKEVQRLDIKPAMMEKTVDGLTLTPEEWRDLTHTFGDYAQPLLKGLLQEPGYRSQPDADRARDIREVIQEARKNAIDEMRQNNPIRFIDQIQDNKMDLMEKVKPSPNLYKRPE
jgi:hypothetical protein